MAITKKKKREAFQKTKCSPSCGRKNPLVTCPQDVLKLKNL